MILTVFLLFLSTLNKEIIIIPVIAENLGTGNDRDERYLLSDFHLPKKLFYMH